MSLDFLRQLAALAREQESPQIPEPHAISRLSADASFVSQETAAPEEYDRPIPLFEEAGKDGSPGVADPLPLANAPLLPEDAPVSADYVRQLMAYFTHTSAALPRSTALALLARADALLAPLPALESVEVPPGSRVAVFGDVHGQFFDMVHAMRLAGVAVDARGEPLVPEDLTLLFLGDYVDRGDMGTEVVLTLCALKAHCPARVHLIRGNHECRSIFTVYGFSDESARKYGDAMLDAFAELFRHLPLGMLVNGRVLAVHAAPPVGADPTREGLGLADIRALERDLDSFTEGSPADELLWSDPNESFDQYMPHQECVQAFLQQCGTTDDPQHYAESVIASNTERQRRKLARDAGASDDDPLPDRFHIWERGPNASTSVRLRPMDEEADEAVVKPSCRGAGFVFSRAVVAAWMRRNGVTLVLRGHQAQACGWARHWPLHAERDGLEFWTVFSAADYNQTGNCAAILVLRLDDAGEVVAMEPREWQPLSTPRAQHTNIWVQSLLRQMLLQHVLQSAAEQ